MEPPQWVAVENLRQRKATSVNGTGKVGMMQRQPVSGNERRNDREQPSDRKWNTHEDAKPSQLAGVESQGWCEVIPKNGLETPITTQTNAIEWHWNTKNDTEQFLGPTSYQEHHKCTLEDTRINTEPPQWLSVKHMVLCKATSWVAEKQQEWHKVTLLTGSNTPRTTQATHLSSNEVPEIIKNCHS